MMVFKDCIIMNIKLQTGNQKKKTQKVDAGMCSAIRYVLLLVSRIK